MNASAAAAAAIKKTETSTILRRIAENDKTAIADCLDAYGDFIWTLSRKFTRSREEAARATEEIFADIWRCGEGVRNARSTEKDLITMIALRRLIKFSREAESKSTPGIAAPIKQRVGANGISSYA